jgi:hypothetical protein
MSVSVRLPSTVEQRLVSFCVRQSLTKSEVLIQAITDYLGQQEADALPGPDDDNSKPVSPIFQALSAGGLIGKVALGEPNHPSATKARVAEIARERIRRSA